MRFIKYFIQFFILLNLFIICLYFGISSVWEGIDLALIFNNWQLMLTNSLTPYWKELLCGSVIFFTLFLLACYYWKLVFPFMLLFDIGYFILNFPSPQTDISLFRKEYKIPYFFSPTGQKKKNIIVISLESFENLFTWPDVVGENLLPNLTKLKNSTGTTFHGYYAMESMRPTIPSFIAVNCGIPRGTNVFNFFENLWRTQNYGGYTNVVCLSDLLKKYGYSTYFIMGANLTDEGTDKFMQKHPMSISVGREELKKMGYSQKNSNYRIPDSELFRFVRNTLTEKKSKNPFFLYLVTGNSHGPKQFITETFCTSDYKDGRDSFKCLDTMVTDFISWCQKQDWYRDTVIYLIGDHLAWSEPLDFVKSKNIKNHSRREIFNLVLEGNSVSFPKIIKKAFTQIDFAPTIFESAGFNLIPGKWGIGISLWSDKPTLVERLGQKNLEQELEKSQTDYFNIIYEEKVPDLQVGQNAKEL